MPNISTIRQAATMLAIGLILSGSMALSLASADTAEPILRSEAIASGQTPLVAPMAFGPQCKEVPLLMAEGSNSCEIVSCGMGIKDTCKITCPADKTPKCSCDCLKTFGPMCTEYKANCKCE